MANEYTKICPTCRMSSSMNVMLSKKGEEFVCTHDPSHKFSVGKDGFLKSV